MERFVLGVVLKACDLHVLYLPWISTEFHVHHWLKTYSLLFNISFNQGGYRGRFTFFDDFWFLGR